MAKKDEQPNPEERADQFIAEYQAQYSEAIAAAREAAKTTETEAWQSFYQKNMDKHKQVVNQHIDTIKQQCEVIGTNDTAEDFEKEIKDAVKGLAEERIRHGAWRTRAITPYEEAAEKPRIIADNCLNAASEAERKQPLVDRGLREEIGKRLRSWPVATWDEETGAIEIDEKNSEADENAA